jgi:hypothetical protein
MSLTPAQRAALLRERIQAIGALLAIPEAVELYRTRNEFAGATYQNIQFPNDLSDAYIHMRFDKYVRRSINNQPFLEPQNAIKLPIPSKLIDSTDLDYSPETLGPAYGAAVEAISRTPEINGLGDLNRIGGQIISAGATAVGLAALQAALNPTQQAAISATTGLTINQFQTMTFKSPVFKNHSFSWKLVPKNEDESNRIENIIRLFKYHSLPSASSATLGSGLYGYPETLTIKLFTGNKDQYLYKFKPCVVKNVSVNYAPNGPSFYRGTRAPTAVELSISLVEIELWSKTDYLRDPNDPTGAPRTIAESIANLRIGPR